MSTYRFFSIAVLAVLLATAAFAVRNVVSNHPYTESKEQSLREYQLGERYGETAGNSVLFSKEEIQREYMLGERYGVTPAEYARQQALREYWLGERYGQRP